MHFESSQPSCEEELIVQGPVQVTRARRHVALICDSETLSRHEFLSRLVQYFEEHGAYLSAAELIPD